MPRPTPTKARKTSRKTSPRKPATRPAKSKPAEQEEFPISIAGLHRMYVSIRETSDWAKLNRHKLPISEGTTVGATLGLLSGDLLAVPADGKTIYPVAAKGPKVIAATTQALRRFGALRAAAKKSGVAVVILTQDVFAAEEWQKLLADAGTRKWPLVFVVATTKWRAVNAPVPEIDVEGQDPVAVYRVVGEATRRARNGRGAAVIRSHGVATTGIKHAPLARLEHYLEQKGLLTDTFRESVKVD